MKPCGTSQSPAGDLPSDSNINDTSGLHGTTKGITYQLKLAMLFFLKAISKNDDFVLWSEKKIAGKFDDVVFTYKNVIKNRKESILLQAKHKISETNKITYDSIIHNSDFFVPKYYNSWATIKKSFPHLTYLVICTTVDIEEKSKEKFKQSDCSYLIEYSKLFHLDCENKKGAVYCLTEDAREDLFPKLWEGSDACKLCIELCAALCSRTPLSARSEVMQRYHSHLVTKVLKVSGGTASFRCTFKTDPSPEVSDFRDALKKSTKLHAEKCKLKKMCKLSDFTEVLGLEMNVLKNFNDDKKIDTSLPRIPTNEDFNQFADKLLFAVNQPSEIQLDDILTEELKLLIKCDNNLKGIAYRSLLVEFLNWFKDKPGEVLNKESRKEILDQIKAIISFSDSASKQSAYIEILKICKFKDITKERACIDLVFFLENGIGDDKPRVVCFDVKNTVIGLSFVLQVLETTETYKKENSFIFEKVSSLQASSDQNRIIASLKRNNASNFLLLECDACQNLDLEKFLDSVVEHTRAQVVLVAPRGFHSSALEGLPLLLTRNYGFSDLSPETQGSFLKRTVILQGSSVFLKQLFPSEELYATIDCDTLEKLILGTEIKFGEKMTHLKALDSQLYIERKLYQTINLQEVEESQQELSSRPTPYTIIVSSEAGAGKTHFLANQANITKNKHTNCVVAYVDLNSHSRSLNDELILRNVNKPSFSRSNVRKAVIFLIDKLLNDNSLKKLLKAYLENKVSGAYVFFDGFDEISPDYAEVVVELMCALQECGVGLVLTTRPHMRQYTEQSLGVLCHSLSVFTDSEKTEFIHKYKKINKIVLNIDLNKKFDSIMEKIRSSEMYKSICGIPLFLKMVLRVICSSLISEDSQPILVDSDIQNSINALYKNFLESVVKSSLMKLRDALSTQNIQMRITEILEIHEYLALFALLKDNISDLLSKKELLKVKRNLEALKEGIKNDGLVTDVVDDKPVFSHRSFTEYLVAVYFSELFKNKWNDEKSRNVFVSIVLTKDNFVLTRKFFDSKFSDDESMDFLNGNCEPELRHKILENSKNEGNNRILRNASKWLTV